MRFPEFLKAKIIAHLRRIGYLNVTYKHSMQSAHRERGQWQCCQCKKLTTRKDLHGDHILPVIEPSVGFVDWNTYIDRLFLGQIQPICKECHAKKTKEENKVRKEVKQGKVWEDV